MPTQVPVGSALARKVFSVAVFAATQRRPSFSKNITGAAPKQSDAERKLKGQTSPDFPIVRITDLSKSAGESVSVDLFNIIKGKPVTGDKKLSGKMMNLTYSSMDIRIDQCRGGVDTGGRMAQQRTLHQLRQIGAANLAGWNSRLNDQQCQVHLAGARGDDTGSDWVIPLATDPEFGEIVVNTIKAPTYNRKIYGGGAADSTTDITGVAAADYLALEDIDRLRAILDELVFPMQPIRIPGDEATDENPLFLLQVTSRQWHYLQTNTTGQTWRTFLANAHARSEGFKHPLFLGTPGLWNGILIKKTSRAIRFNAGSSMQENNSSNVEVAHTVPAGVTVDRAILLGAQALGDVYGRHQKSDFYFNWHEEETDHGNTLEISTASINGKAKITLDVDGVPTDHGVFVVDSAAPAIT